MQKHTILIFIFFLTTFLCFGQKEHLEPTKDFNQHGGVLKEYYDNLFPLLYSGFSDMPYARYTSMPSFSAEYAFSVEKINEKNYIISNKFSENFWYAGYDNNGNMVNEKRNTVKIATVKTEISDDLYLIIGELFELFVEQTKVKERKFDTLPDGTIVEIHEIGTDGETYIFTTTDKNGEIRTGTTWSPHPSDKPLLSRLVEICDNLYLLGIENDISQTNILREIDILINDFKN